MNKKYNYWPPIFLIGGLFVAIIIAIFINAVPGQYQKSMLVMGTAAEIIVKDKNTDNAQLAVNQAFDEIKRLEKVFSFHNPDSELNKINNNAFPAPYRVSDEMYQVLEQSMSASDKTSGLFDITSGSLSRLYGFTMAYNKRVPNDNELVKTMKLVDYRLIRLDPANRTVRFVKKGILLDMGGVVKGYAVDRAVSVLRENGIKAALVNIGGNMYGFGHKPWKIGVRHPRDKDKIIEIITLKDEGVATSGDYERFFINNSVRVHHIFDPRTGKSASGNIGVTIIAGNALTADIYSTGIFVLDHKKAKEVIKKENLMAIIVSEDNGGDITIDKVGII
ncbi:MAG: FAD:protein FMN transferase [Candidatus Margulisiibacteriota bacterium]